MSDGTVALDSVKGVDPNARERAADPTAKVSVMERLVILMPCVITKWPNCSFLCRVDMAVSHRAPDYIDGCQENLKMKLKSPTPINPCGLADVSY